MELKFHLHADGEKFNQILNKHIDTLVGLNEEVFAEGLTYHEKQYKGVIRDKFFEATSKHEVGVLRTYNPWIIRGDFTPVGSNVELSLSLKKTKSLNEVLMLLAIFPLVIVLITWNDNGLDGMNLLILILCLAIPVGYHLASRWIRFSTLRHFIQLVNESISTTRIPN